MAEKKDATIKRADGAGGTVEIPAAKPVEDQPAEGSLKNADQTSNPVPNDAEPHDPPVRTNRPDGEMIASLGVGAGAHEPTSDPDIDVEGRFVGHRAAAAKKA